jgi:hypothetical protein
MLKHLNVEEMVALIAPWVKKTKRRTTFLSIPEIAPFHSKVTQAYNAVLVVRPSQSTTSPELTSIVEEATRVDERHDHLARAIALSLEAQRELCLAQDSPDAARAARCDEITVKLFPSGLSIVNASLLAESGNTARVAHLIKEEEPAIADFLKTITVGKATLLENVQRWIATGARLEKLEHDREEVLAKVTTQPITKATIQAARSQWFRVMSQVLSSLELSDAPAVAIEAIRGPVLRASERAGKRYASGVTEQPVLDPEDQAEAEGGGEGGGE